MKKVIELFSGNADITKALINSGLSAISVDYCKSYDDFLGRCRIPELLIKDIVKAIKYLMI